MKVAAILAATASANPTQFIMDNWWKEAVNVFNFASGNWAQFAQTVDNVSNGMFPDVTGSVWFDQDEKIISDPKQLLVPIMELLQC